MNKVKITENYVYHKNGQELTILHMADIHFNVNTKQKLFTKIINKVAELKPNYLIITGDIIDKPTIIKENKQKLKELVKFLADLGEITKVLISLGNHDIMYEEDFKFFKKIDQINNIYVLNNQIYSDEYIYVAGFTLPGRYYYNLYGKESVETLLKELKLNSKLLTKLPNNKVKIGLFHSPIGIINDEVWDKLNEFDLLLSGHMHDGMVPDFLKVFFPKNMGIISPAKKLFPKICRGRVNKDGRTLIITGGITKLSLKSAKRLSKFNFVYNIGINKIILTNKKGRYYGKN